MIIKLCDLRNYFFDISDIFAVEQTSDKKTVFVTPQPRPTDAFLLFLTTSGICYQKDAPPIIVHPGSVVYLPKNSHYTFENSPAGSNIQKNLLFEYTLSIAKTTRSGLPKRAVSRINPPGERISFGDKVTIVSTHNSELYKKLFYDLISALNNPNFMPLTVYQTAYEIFNMLSSDSHIEQTGIYDIRLIKNSLQYLEENSASSKTIKEIADTCHVSLGYYERIFRSCFGISPTEYRNMHRINQIKMKLREDDIDLNELSEKMGYCDSGYLCRFFKSKTGMTPMKYRRICRKDINPL